MISTLNTAYHVREGRSFVKVGAIAVALTIAISICLMLALAVVLIGSYLANVIGAALHLSELFVLGWKIVQWPAALFFIVPSFSLVYYFGPDLKERHWYWVTPGSVFGVMLWLAASAGFRSYAFFQHLYQNLRIAGRCHCFARMVLRNRTGVFNWRRNQCRDRTCRSIARAPRGQGPRSKSSVTVRG